MYVGGHGHIGPPDGALVDPLEIFDATDGLVLHEGVTEYEIAGHSVDLRAQVWGGTVDTYEWDLSGATGAINITGDDTGRLQFDWDEEGVGEQYITLHTVNIDTTEQDITLTFSVQDTLDEAQEIFSEDWQEVVTPDQERADGQVVSSQYYDVSLTSGALYIPHRLPSYNPGMPALELVYSSMAASPRPIFVVRQMLDPEEETPDQVSAQLTLNSRGRRHRLL